MNETTESKKMRKKYTKFKIGTKFSNCGVFLFEKKVK